MAKVDELQLLQLRKGRVTPLRLACVIIFLLATFGCLTYFFALQPMRQLYWGGERGWRGADKPHVRGVPRVAHLSCRVPRSLRPAACASGGRVNRLKPSLACCSVRTRAAHGVGARPGAQRQGRARCGGGARSGLLLCLCIHPQHRSLHTTSEVVSHTALIALLVTLQGAQR